ncbi:MAG: hypothetical protein ACLR6T_01545 [Intestinibacter sp.]
MAEDMSDIFQKMNDMLKNNQIPEDVKNMLNQFTSGSSNNSSSDASTKNDTSSSNEPESSTRETSSTDDNQTEIPNFDIGTMLKMKSIIDSMNKQQNDPRANLLRSLKPYLKNSRKEKVDQYIKLFSMGKVFEMINPLGGGDKKNDV